MSEHWKSTPKYWCKHCSTYVKDTPFEKKQHENTGKHQGNLKRFLDGIQKDHAKNEREKERAKAEIDRLNRVAGAGAHSSSTSTLPPTLAPRTANTSSVLSAADQKRQWAQLADMGIAVPDHARGGMAMPGNWQTTSRKVDAKSEDDLSADDKLNVGVRKRKFNGEEEDEEDAPKTVRKGWGSATRSYPGSNSQSDDLDALLAGPILKKASGVKDASTKHVDTALISNDGQPCDLVKLEPPEDNTALLPTSGNRESDVKPTTPRCVIGTKDATSEKGTTPRDLEVAAPVFRKRKANKLLPAT